jgi:hypothetical protein
VRSTTRKLTVSAAVAALGGALLVLPATAEAGTSDVHVVHAIPGVTVDVCLDGAKALTDFAPNTRTAAVPITAEDHTVEVVAAGDACDDGAGVIGPVTVTVPGPGLDLDLVAHLDKNGAPTLSAFANDLGRTGAGDARIVVRHTATAPEVDVLAGGSPVLTGLANATPDGMADSDDLEVPAGTYPVNVAPTGTTTGVFDDDIQLTVAAGTQYIIYAAGSLAGDSFTVYPFAVEVGQKSASRIAGADRFQTAVEISKVAYPDGAPVVYLARHDQFPDALAAKSLQDGPLLIVPSCGDLADFPAITAELARIDPDRVVALGGTAAICDAVLDAALAAAG